MLLLSASSMDMHALAAGPGFWQRSYRAQGFTNLVSQLIFLGYQTILRKKGLLITHLILVQFSLSLHLGEYRTTKLCQQLWSIFGLSSPKMGQGCLIGPWPVIILKE